MSRNRVGNADVAWDSFDSDSYFQHNYGELRADDSRIIEIVADFFAVAGRSGPLGHAVDVGAGANLYPALTMLPFASRISLCERAHSNRRWLASALSEPQESWSGFWSAIAAERPAYQRINRPFDVLADRAEVVRGNVLSVDPEQFDLGTMFFVAESITTRPHEFERATRRFVGSLRGRAPFAAAFMRNSTGYVVGNRSYPACSVDEADVERAFAPFAGIDLAVVDSSDLRPGYRGMIVVTGRKK